MRHDGKAENVYQTKEAAFEAVIAAASLALRQGHEVRISAPGQRNRHRCGERGLTNRRRCGPGTVIVVALTINRPLTMQDSCFRS